jgi:hypothetical protein
MRLIPLTTSFTIPIKRFFSFGTHPIKFMFPYQTGSINNIGQPSPRILSANSAFGPLGLLRIQGNAQSVPA